MQPYNLYLVSHAHMHTHGTNERDGGNARERRRLNGIWEGGERGKDFSCSSVKLGWCRIQSL